ncbi:MAG: hypothetical protein Q9196_004379 [Gyalolechia fulgens]
MTSSWEFYAFRGHLSKRAGLFAWNRAFTEAVDDHELDKPMGTRMRRWSGVFPDDGTVDVVVAPLPGMTWRMLVEGVRGAELVLASRVEFKFQIMAEGLEGIVGYGETTRRRSAVSLGRLKERRQRMTLPPPPSSLGRVADVHNL